MISKRGYANVIPPGDETEEEDPEELDTYGVVYTLTKSDMAILDMYEGVDMKPVHAYLKVTMDLEMYEKGEGVELPCLVYVDLRTELGKVHEEYIGRINHGLEDAGLPETWVEKVVRKWIPKGGDVEGESESEIEEQDVGERKGVERKMKVKHWVPTGV